MEDQGRRGWALRWPVALAGLALGLRAWQPGPTLLTTDEFSWTSRARAFGEALSSGDLAAATTGPLQDRITRPGVTTMWAGHIGGQLAESSLPFFGSHGLLRNGQLMVSVLCAVGLWMFVVAAAPVVGRRAALIAGGLLAVEPVLVGHSAILHTDALVTMFAATGTVALAAAVQAVRAEVRAGTRAPWYRASSLRYGLLAGIASALAMLTKINAAALLGPALLAVVGLAAVAVRRREPQSWRPWCRGVALSLGAVLASAALLTVALWPALWIDPLGNLGALVDTARLSTSHTPRFFLGSVAREGDPRFYLVVGLLRTSAWLLVLGTVAVGAVLGARLQGRPRRVPRSASWALAVPPVVYGLAITLSDKQYGRYYLPLVPFATLFVGVALSRLADDLPRSWRPRATALGIGALASAAAWTWTLAPYAASHVDPLVGGQEAAVARIPLGWGEGKEWASQRLGELGPGPCPTVSARGWLLHPCKQDFAWLEDGSEPPDYVVVYVFERQQGETRPEDRYLARHGQLVDALSIDGVDYVEIWDTTPQE